MRPLSIVLPSYCSWRHLEANLPPLLKEAGRFGAEVLVADDASPDDTVERVRTRFPNVRLVARDTNAGFGENCNTGVREATGEFVYLMNSDVCVQPGFLEPLVECLEREHDVFCISSIAVSEDGTRVLDGPRWGAFHRGHLKWKKLDRSRLLEATEPVPTLYAVGAHVLIHRARFLEIGGFDRLFAPYYWEDVDLCYRAWKRGWRVLCHPASRVVHRRAETSDITRTQGLSNVSRMIHRNRFLFTWKNLHDPRILWTKHLLPIALRFAFGWLVYDLRFYRSLFAALPYLPDALVGRRRALLDATQRDRDILWE